MEECSIICGGVQHYFWRSATLFVEECNIICEIYKDDLDAFSLQAQLKLLPDFVKGSNLSLSELIPSGRYLHQNNQSWLKLSN